jgi:hypothetical protein
MDVELYESEPSQLSESRGRVEAYWFTFGESIKQSIRKDAQE